MTFGPLTRLTVFAAVVIGLGVIAIMSGSAPDDVAAEQPQTRVMPPMYRILYLANDTERHIGAAKSKLIVDCMASHGLTYAPYVEPEAMDDQVLASLRPFGLESIDSVTTEPLPPEPTNSAEYARALFGDPDNQIEARGQRLEISIPATGCQADAEYRLLGDQRQRATVVRLELYDGERDAREQLDKDGAFKSANQRWRACLNRSRIDSPSPGELLGALPANTDLAHDPAIHADLECKQETGYLLVAYARLAALQQDWMDKHASLVNEWLGLQQRQDTVAKQVLAQK